MEAKESDLKLHLTQHYHRNSSVLIQRHPGKLALLTLDPNDPDLNVNVEILPPNSRIRHSFYSSGLLYAIYHLDENSHRFLRHRGPNSR